MQRTLLTLIAMTLGGWMAVLAQDSGCSDLSWVRYGALSKGEAKITAAWQQPSNAPRALEVGHNEVAFTTTERAVESRFTDGLSDDSLSWTVDGFQGRAGTLPVNWCITWQETSAWAEPLAGNWSRTFFLEGSEQPGAQSRSDPGFNANVAHPAYLKNHPKVLFDEAHNNADTSSGRYKPFSDLITNDGYGVMPNRQKFTQSALQGQVVLVIVNASGPSLKRDGPSLTEAECNAVREWVDAGGALLLITDHAPYSAAVGPLAKRFGVDVTIGHTFDTTHYNKETNDQTELLFTRENGLLGEHPIIRGRDDAEQINRVLTFSGTSVKGAEGSVPLLKLADSAMDVLPPDRKPSASPDDPPADHKTVSAAGRAQGLALQFGKGRVVIVAEAAALTAHVAPSGFLFGMNVAGTDNRQFALNIMHWLSGLLK